MTVAVVIPVFNGERFLANAVDSARSQSVGFEAIIVVDDGSTDGTGAWLAEQDDLTILSQRNMGAGAARNAGIRHSSAPILAFLDADDLWRPDYIASQLSALDTNPSAEAVFARVEQFREGEQHRRQFEGFIPSAMMIRREAFLRIGWFDEDPGAPEFTSWFLRASELGLRRQHNPQVLVERRVHAENKGALPGMHRQYLLALKQSLERRRDAAR